MAAAVQGVGVQSVSLLRQRSELCGRKFLLHFIKKLEAKLV